MNRYIPIFLALILCISLQSCFVFGVKTHHLKWADRARCERLYRRYKIKDKEELCLDTTFAKRMKKMYHGDTVALHDHRQPVQYLLFDKQGKLQSFMINCYAHTNMLLYANWNYDHLFDTFPTKTMRPTDDLLTFSAVLNTIRDTADKVPDIKAADYDYVEVVIFSSVLYRASKELIHTVKHQDKKGYRVKTLYINGDNDFLWPYMNAKERKKVLDYKE